MTVRQYVLGKTGLSGDAVGIVAGPSDAAGGGYHCGNDGLSAIGHLTSDYSKRESPRDRPGSNAASALDIGDFTHGGVTLHSLSLAIVAACARSDPRTADVREIIFTPDGSIVRRFDRLGIRSTGDSSHLYHTHISFFRDSEGRRAQAGNILGLLGEIFEGKALEGGMSGKQMLVADSAGVVWLVDGLSRMRVTDVTGAGNGQAHQEALLGNLGNNGQVARFGTPPEGMDVWGIDVGGRLAVIEGRIVASEAADAARDAAVRTAVDTLAAIVTAGGGSVDTTAIKAAIDAAVQRVHDDIRARFTAAGSVA